MLFNGFDFSLLDDPEFKEDSVREELIVPILRELGYSAGGPSKIIRGRNLTHPFVYIGSKQHKVNIIPDYLLEVPDGQKWILDAKSPTEDILKGRNPEQAFSYAIHPEVRAFRYALCNGRLLVVFDISKVDPILTVPVCDIEERFDEVRKYLSPIAIKNPHLHTFRPDFGILLLKIGSSPQQKQIFIPTLVQFVARIEDGKYTLFANVRFDDIYAISFDFDDDRYDGLLRCLPKDKAEEIRLSLRKQPYSVRFTDDIPEVGIEGKLGEVIYCSEEEDYCPLIVERFFSM